MYINKMTITNFRSFQKKTELEFVHGINLITGLNGIGKSTILALLTNSTEFTSSSPVEKPYLGEAFRGEFSDVILYDEKSDNYTKGSTIKPSAEVYFDDRPQNDSINYPERHTYKGSLTSKPIKIISHKKLKLTDDLLESIRKENTYLKTQKQILVKQSSSKTIPRFRFLPDPRTLDNGTSTRAKITWPTLYLGLSRVYPTGENDSAEVKEIPNDNFLQDLPQIHKKILDGKFNDKSVITNYIQGSDAKKKGSGIETEKFGSLANSIGQTNLGQILLAVKSFERLKSQLGETYIGGLLAIDEIDATLHPAAQNDLLKYLYEQSKKLDLQIVVTTHSLSLIDFFSNLRDTSKDYNRLQILQLDYLPDSTNIEPVLNPPISRYTNVLTKRMGAISPTLPKVKVLTEDDVSRWFLEKLFEKYNAKQSSDTYLNNLQLLDVSLGWENVLKLINSDFEYYKNMISVLDPDVSEESINNKSREYIEKFNFNSANGNLFSIPGGTSIEQMFYDFIFSDLSSTMFQQPYLRNQNINRHMLEEDLKNNMEIYQYTKNHKSEFSVKKWYKHNIELVRYSFGFFFEENKQEYFEWLAKLNRSSKRLSTILKS